MTLTSSEHELIRRLVEDLCGIVLDESKDYLIEHRLLPIASRLGCENLMALYRQAWSRCDETARRLIIDAITTSETLFFRDSTPFRALSSRVLPDIVDAKEGTPGAKRLRIWSAACSTGQEVYSIAMELAEIIPDIQNWDIVIAGTDISDAAVRQASAGMYEKLQIARGLPDRLLEKYFHRQDDRWVVKDELRALCTFRRQNLLEPLVNTGPFDIVFCRNVAIYFSEDARTHLWRRIARVMTPTGYLFLGSAESINGAALGFEVQNHCGAVYFQRPGGAP